MLDIFRNDQNSIKTIIDETGISKELDLKIAQVSNSNLEVLKSREFENNLLVYILTGISTETSHYQPLLEEIDNILMLIDSEIEKK
ncbi:hypothetical protein ACSIGC_18030 (plasmid) [Tenacibaculum sp. ZS6-P6]|uniref:hypothetical protein n=1 Tax=Tenacibaculum sp. ZS6-P6 TaxID=3447503 RepID=UPI003F956826